MLRDETATRYDTKYIVDGVSALAGKGRSMIRNLDTVVLTRDLPEHGLRSGDMGAVVHDYAKAPMRWNSLRAVARRWPC